ncbi:MAG: DUF6655 family protein [Gemmataceae bacterium]
MRKPHRREDAGRRGTWAILVFVVLAAGCGTTRTSDTSRTATEQLLISHSIDDSVSRLDFRMLAGKRVFLDAQYLDGITDKGYLISSVRQQLLACGCLLQEERKNATYVIEARAGSVGTDNNGMLVGVPQMSIPSVMPGIPGMMIPEIALAKKTNRRAVAKIAVFAYNRVSGEPIWQSGALQATSRERNSWLCGAGPFQRGSLHRGTEFDEQRIVVPMLDQPGRQPNDAMAGVTAPSVWKFGPLPDDEEVSAKSKSAKQQNAPAGETKVIQASDPSSTSETPNKSE